MSYSVTISMVNQKRVPRRRTIRRRSLEEREILDSPAPIISNENFKIDESFFCKGRSST